MGAYFLIIMAMWTRESCDFPNEEAKLARVARVSLRLWKSRVGPSIMAFLTVEGDAVMSKRLRAEASYTERQVKSQSERRVTSTVTPQQPDIFDKPLKVNEPGSTVDASADISPDRPGNHPRHPPTYYLQPKKKEDDDDDSARATSGGGLPSAAPAGTAPPAAAQEALAPTLRERMLHAIGLPPDGVAGPTGKLLGTLADMERVKRWQSLNLSDDDMVSVMGEMMRNKREAGPPSSFRYFDRGMEKLAGARAADPLTPAAQINGAPRHQAERPPGVDLDDLMKRARERIKR